MKEILKHFIEFIFLKFIYLRYQKKAMMMCDWIQGHLVEKKYLTKSFFFFLKFNYIEGG